MLGAFVLDARLQRLAQRPVQARRFLVGKRLGRAGGVDARAKQRFIGIDIADSRNELLLQQPRFDRQPAPTQARAKAGCCEIVAERLGTQVLQQRRDIVRQVDTPQICARRRSAVASPGPGRSAHAPSGRLRAAHRPPATYSRPDIFRWITSVS